MNINTETIEIIKILNQYLNSTYRVFNGKNADPNNEDVKRAYIQHEIILHLINEIMMLVTDNKNGDK